MTEKHTLALARLPCLCAMLCVYMRVCVCRSGDSLQVLAFSFYQVGPQAWQHFHLFSPLQPMKIMLEFCFVFVFNVCKLPVCIFVCHMSA